MKRILFLYLCITCCLSLDSQITDSIIDIRDGQVYKIIKIGNQWWMAENLNVGTIIDGGQDATNNDIIEKYCYNNIDSLCSIYGALYQWYEMMNYLQDNIHGIIQGICPSGWHLPTDNEWTELIDFLGGVSIAGGKLKEAGTIHWESPNVGATNGSSFTALPSGGGNYVGTFFLSGIFGMWWSSTQDNANGASLWNLNYNRNKIDSYYEYVRNYCSVRCVKD